MSTRTVVITGASSGIDAALAQQLAKQGAAVALVARREAALEAVAATCSGRIRNRPARIGRISGTTHG